MPETVPSIPAGYTAVTPWVIVRDCAHFLNFIREVFGAEELARLVDPVSGRIAHAEARIGDAVVMAFDAGDGWPDTPQFLRLYVDDANAVFERAIAAGCWPVTQVTMLGFGDQVGRVADPWGNVWWLQQRVEELSFEEMGRRMQDPTYVAAMSYVQDTLEAEMQGRGA